MLHVVTFNKIKMVDYGKSFTSKYDRARKIYACYIIQSNSKSLKEKNPNFYLIFYTLDGYSSINYSLLKICVKRSQTPHFNQDLSNSLFERPCFNKYTGSMSS